MAAKRLPSTGKFSGTPTGNLERPAQLEENIPVAGLVDEAHGLVDRAIFTDEQLYQQERSLRELEQEQERNKKEIRKRDEERRKADKDERHPSPAVDRSRNEYRQIQPVPTPSPTPEERAKQEKQRNEIEQIKRQIQQLGEQAKPADAAQ